MNEEEIEFIKIKIDLLIKEIIGHTGLLWYQKPPLEKTVIASIRKKVQDSLGPEYDENFIFECMRLVDDQSELKNMADEFDKQNMIAKMLGINLDD